MLPSTPSAIFAIGMRWRARAKAIGPASVWVLTVAWQTIDLSTLAPTLRAFREKVAAGIARAEDLTAGLPPTYFTYAAQEYETLADAAGQPLRDGHGRPYVRVKRFEQSVLPHFLEGPMHALKTRKDAAGARTLYRTRQRKRTLRPQAGHV